MKKWVPYLVIFGVLIAVLIVAFQLSSKTPPATTTTTTTPTYPSSLPNVELPRVFF